MEAGDAIAKIRARPPRPRTSRRSARVAELFEARKPKDPAIISEIDGRVEFAGMSKGCARS